MEKIILVTGSTSGLGKELVYLLSKDNNVIIHYHNNEDKALEIKKEIDSLYDKDVMTIYADLKNEDDINKMINDIYERYGRIDVLINNAAIERDCMFEDKTKDDFLDVLEVNLVAPFLLSKKIGLKMKENKNGIIINVSSTNGIDTYYPESLDYDASKAGLINLSHNLANYLAPYVRVNTVCPGWMNTDMNKNLDSDFIKKEEDKILLGRFGEAEEVGNVIKFLISDEASYVNDSVIRVDGGKKC